MILLPQLEYMQVAIIKQTGVSVLLSDWAACKDLPGASHMLRRISNAQFHLWVQNACAIGKERASALQENSQENSHPAPHLGEIRSASLLTALDMDRDVVPRAIHINSALNLRHLCFVMKHAKVNDTAATLHVTGPMTLLNLQKPAANAIIGKDVYVDWRRFCTLWAR